MSLLPLQSTLTSWLTLAVLVLGPGIVATVFWSPVLASSRFRALFQRLPLTGSPIVNYVVVAMGLSLPWVVGFGWAFAVIGSQVDGGSVQAEPVFLVAFLLGVVYLVGLPLVAGVGLPRLGVDWDENDYGVTTWLLLLVAGAWYAAIYAVPAFVTGVIVELPF